jgi:hypothetical protein
MTLQGSDHLGAKVRLKLIESLDRFRREHDFVSHFSLNSSQNQRASQEETFIPL